MRTRTLGRWMGLAAAVLGLGGWVLAHLPGRELHGSDEVGNLILYLRSALPDLHITVEDMILAGDKIVCRWTIRGTNTGPFGGRPATGRPVKYTGIDIIRCRDGQIAELWGEYDSRGLDLQLQ